MNPYPAFLATEEAAEHISPPEIRVIAAPDRRLQIAVLFTSVESTIAALHRAVALLKGLDGRILLIEVQAVPYPLPLNRPPVSLDFTKQRLLEIAAESDVDVAVHLYLCRFRWETIARILKPGAVIVIGCQKKWWPSWEKKIARKLQRVGYQTIPVEAPKAGARTARQFQFAVQLLLAKVRELLAPLRREFTRQPVARSGTLNRARVGW